MFSIRFFAGVFFIFSATLAFPQTLAFPGALGYGAYATGGRGGTVYHVTNTNDSGAGSFRDAVSHSGRIIVFDVGGHVTLQSAISCSGNLTIAGQTAPGGICFDAGEISFSSRANIICRYIRIRPGSATSSVNDDSLGMYQTTNAIIDHVSVGYGPYDNIDAVSANNLSFQNCIDANPIGQQFGAHIENVNADCSWQYNLFISSHNRNPLEKIDDTFINNVLYNCNAGYTTHTSTRFTHDIVNNYFVSGPGFGGSSDFPWFQVDKNQSIYYSGNLFDGNDNGTLDGSATTPYWYQGTGTVLSSPWSSWTAVIPTVSAPLAWRYDVSASGAFPRDDVDSLIISQTKTIGSGTTGTGAGTTGPGTGLYTSQSQDGLSNNGYGSSTGGTAPSNFSGDGIADYWKLANNLSTNISYPLTNTATGYTLLENYLNFLAAPHAVTQTNTPVLVNLAQFTAGFSAGATFSLTNSTNGTASLVNGTNANFIPNANFSGLGTFTFTVNDSGLALSAPVAVCITPVTPPASAAGFNGALEIVATNAAASVVVPPNNLLWHGDGTANVWNTSASNWLNNATTSKYKDGDIVTFDDTGSLSPAVNLSAAISPGAIYFNDNQNYTLSGVGALSGSASLSKTGSGTLTVNTTNSGFSGAITVNGGAFVVGPSASVGSANITLSGGALFTTSFGGALVTVPGSVTVAAGDSAVLASGPAQLGNEYSGNIISGDTNSFLTLSNGVSFNGPAASQFSSFFGTISIPAGATLRFALASSGNTFGSLNPTFLINGTLQPRNSTNTILLGALNGSGQITGTQSGTNGIGVTVYNIGGNNQNGVFNGTVASNTAAAASFVCLVKTGSGTQTLNGNDTFTGTNAVMAGALLLNGSNQPVLTTVFTNATLAGTGTINGIVRVNSGGILSPGANSAGTLTINGHLTNNSPILNFTLSSSPSGSNDLINMTGTLAMTGAQMFNFALSSNALGAGTYNLIQGANNSTQSGVTLTNNLPGNTRQNIALGAASPGSNPSYVQLLVSGTASSLLWLGTNGGNWDLSTTNWFNGATADQYYNLDTVTFDDTAATGTLSLAAPMQPAAMTVSNNSLAYTFGGSGSLAGSGPLTKTGSAKLTVTTTNSSYSGSITLNSGSLAVGSSANLGSGPITIGGAELDLPGSGNSAFLGNPVSVSAGQTATITSGVASSGFSGNFSSGDSSSILNLAGGVSFSATTSAQFDGFTGTIKILNGTTLRLSAGNSGYTLGSFNPTLVINGTLQPRNAGNTIQLGSFSGSGTLAGQSTQPASGGGTGTTTYLVGGNNTSATFSGTVIDSNPTNLTVLYKTGTGTLALSGNSTFSGGTTVTAGTLLVSNLTGSATGSGDMEIFSGATLTGNGIIGSSVTIDNGATLAPGSPNGTLTISNNLTLNDNSILQFGLGTTSDSVSVSGGLFLTGQVQVSNTGGFGVGSYTLFTCGGAMSIGNLVLASAPPGFNYSFNTNTPGVVKLIVAPTTPPNFNGINVNPGPGSLSLAGSNGVPLGNYLVLQSSNLLDWTAVATNQFDTNGGFNFTTNVPTGSPQNFFRLQLQP